MPEHQTVGEATRVPEMDTSATQQRTSLVRRLGPRLIRQSAVVFWLMFAINAVNYLDRFLVVAVGPILKTSFHIRDEEIGALASAFILIYVIAAVPAGLLADRLSRARVIAAGVAIWSVASAATSFVGGFRGLFATRAAVGIGEASYYPAGTALLGAYYPLKQRARIMSRWQSGQIVGMALAFVLSAVLIHLLGESTGWRVAFLVAGPPGLVLAALMWVTADSPAAPTHPTQDGQVVAASEVEAAPKAHQVGALARIGEVLRIRTVWLVVVLQGLYFIVATPAVTFLPIYLRSSHGPFHTSPAATALLSGIMIVVGGTVGILLGGNVADWIDKRLPGGRILAAALGFGTALPFYALMLLTHSLFVFVVVGTLAVLLLNLQAGPLAAAMQDATPAQLRATAVAVALLLSHMLGDVWAPNAVGHLSTSLHERSGVALLIIGAPALAVATIVGIVGARYYAAEVARSEAASGAR